MSSQKNLLKHTISESVQFVKFIKQYLSLGEMRDALPLHPRIHIRMAQPIKVGDLVP